MLKNKCPNCHKGKVFKAKNILFTLGFSDINKKCEICDFKFEKEPGYFFGAMYVSYAMAILEGLLIYFFSLYILGISEFYANLFIICFTILLLSFFNFRFSRLLWIYLLKNL